MNDTYSPTNPRIQSMIDSAVTEAERGYDVEFLRNHTTRAGRPLNVGTQTAAAVTVRFDPARLAALDALARDTGKTRSQIVREATDVYLAAV